MGDGNAGKGKGTPGYPYGYHGPKPKAGKGDTRKTGKLTKRRAKRNK